LGATERVSALELDPAAGYWLGCDEKREEIRHEQTNERTYKRTNNSPWIALLPRVDLFAVEDGLLAAAAAAN